MMRKFIFTLLLAALTHGLNTARFDEVVTKLESHVLDYRDFMEKLYLERRYNETSLGDCQAANYHECDSALPNPICPLNLDFATPDCGEGEKCSGFVDFTRSIYSTAPGVSATNSLVVESICFSRYMDDWLIQRSQQDSTFWEELRVEPWAMYFGSINGAFRMFPGRSSQQCGTYDPTIRPWYVAGSSGPKNIVLVLDKSGSMQGPRLSLMKEAAIRVIETLTISDRVAIVVFDEVATMIAEEDTYLYSATNENKQILIDVINDLEARGQTNIFDAFDKAFDILDNSISQEFTVNCNSAILFLTDGEMTHPEDTTQGDVIDLVNRRLNVTSSSLGKPVMLFSYSVAEEEEVHELPKQLACSTMFGTWSRIDRNEKIVEALSSYYLLFALGLGAESNSDFTAWVEPYNFSTGNILGTTVSAPVYDRSKTPHLFVGVVAIDIALSALNRALEADSSTESIARLARRSVARCPALELTLCELESYRAASGGNEARCFMSQCSADDLVETIATQCTDSSRYPTDLLANMDLAGLSYEDSVCCVGENSTSDTNICTLRDTSGKDVDAGADNETSSRGRIIALSVGLSVVFLVVCFFVSQCLGALFACCAKDETTPKQPDDQYALPPPVSPSAPMFRSR